MVALAGQLHIDRSAFLPQVSSANKCGCSLAFSRRSALQSRVTQLEITSTSVINVTEWVITTWNIKICFCSVVVRVSAREYVRVFVGAFLNVWMCALCMDVRRCVRAGWRGRLLPLIQHDVSDIGIAHFAHSVYTTWPLRYWRHTFCAAIFVWRL